MTSVELRQKLKKLSEGILKTESELNDLHQQQIDTNRKLSKISAEIGIANKKFDDKRKAYFKTQIELDTRVSEEKAKQRQIEIDKRKQFLPTFDFLVKKELKDIVREIVDLDIKLGINVSDEVLFTSFCKIRDDRFPSHEQVILNESINRYDEILTNLIEKELDGGRVDLMEKRNLKQPVVNFLNNQRIKNSLQI